jgi:hypothetical protein
VRRRRGTGGGRDPRCADRSLCRSGGRAVGTAGEEPARPHRRRGKGGAGTVETLRESHPVS